MDETPALRSRTSPPVRAVERAIFSSRWLLAPFYLGLILALFVLLGKFVQRIIALFTTALDAGSNEIIIGILSLIDLSLMANLMLIVIFAGYESFVSRLDLDGKAERLDWMGRIGFGDLKLKLMASIVAVSAIHVLEEFMNVNHVSDRDLAWVVGIQLAFVVSGLLLALMDRLMERAGH